jgi:CrcB protein
VITVVLFAVMAGLGALTRTEAGALLNRPDGMPYGTLLVNVVGSFLLGMLAGTAPPAATVLGVAGLGAFTTFSSFARDVVALAERRRPALAILYVVASCAGAIVGAALGVATVG